MNFKSVKTISLLRILISKARYVVALVGFILMIHAAFFLYHYYFGALDDSETLVQISGMIASESIDIQMFNRVLKNINNKKTHCLTKDSLDPFVSSSYAGQTVSDYYAAGGVPDEMPR